MNWKIVFVIVAMTSTTVVVADQDIDLTFETILKEFDGGPDKATELAIQSENEWKDFVKTCTSESTRKTLGKHEFDFDKETIVIVCPGKNSSILGHADYEKQSGVQGVQRRNDKVTVEYNIAFSDHQDTKDKYPIHVAKIAKQKNVVFRKSKKVFAG